MKRFSAGMNNLLAGIVDDDTATVKQLLKADTSLTTQLIKNPKLYKSGIFHWIYARDTALHLAAAGYRVGLVRLLVEFGADPNAAHNMRKSTPLHYAADGFITGAGWDPPRQVETIRCLLQRGANVHAQDLNGATPLHRAVRTRCAAAVKFLLNSGSDPMMKNRPGSTPFHLAVQNTGRGGSGAPAAIAAQREIIAEFLARDVSPNLKDSRGKTVADSARSQWICEMLS